MEAGVRSNSLGVEPGMILELSTTTSVSTEPEKRCWGGKDMFFHIRARIYPAFISSQGTVRRPLKDLRAVSEWPRTRRWKESSQS